MLAVWDSVVRHNLKRGGFYVMVTMSCLVIYSLTDSYTTAKDLIKGNLAPTEAAIGGALVVLIYIVLNELPIEISKKSHLLILSKPMSRTGYVMGKILGCYTLSVIVLSIFVAVAYMSLLTTCEHDVPFNNNFLKPLCHYMCFLWIITVMSCVCGLFLSEAFTIMILGFYAIGSYFIGVIPAIMVKSKAAGFLEILLNAFYFIFPNYQLFSPGEYLSYNIYVGMYLVLYSLCITLVVLPITLYKFNKISFS